MAVRSWEEKEGEWECKNQIRCHPHHWDKGGREDLMIATPGRDDAHINSAARAYMVLLDVQLAAGEGGCAAQNAVEDDGGGTVMGGGEDHGVDWGNANGNGHGQGHGHGQRRCNWMMEELCWQIDTIIPGDDVMAEDGLTFLLLQIGHRTQSSAYSTTHKCFQKMVVGTLQSNNHLEVSFW